MTKLVAALAVFAAVIAFNATPSYAGPSKARAKSNVVSVVTVVHACRNARR
jgi:hypothetical protein